MAYDANRVSFSAQEHEMADSLDKVIEQFKDGFQVEDIATIIGAVPLIEYIAAGGDVALAIQRLLTLGLMLERDNRYIEAASAGLSSE